jgi:hypothetical protein
MTTLKSLPATLTLGQRIIDHGPIVYYRVSSAQARGVAGRYPYYGAVRYEITLGPDELPRALATYRATSDRRSLRLAELDADRLAQKNGALRLQVPAGRIDEQTAKVILRELGVDA